MIVYASEHGEMAGEHGLWWKNRWHEASARIPSLISTAEQRREAALTGVCQAPLALIDLFRTLLSLAGAVPAAELDGEDLSAVLVGGPAPDDPVVTDSLAPRWCKGTEFRMVRQGRYDYGRFHDALPLAFDLENDPEKQRNLLPEAEIPAGFALPLATGGNVYTMPDGRLVKADETLHHLVQVGTLVDFSDR